MSPVLRRDERGEVAAFPRAERRGRGPRISLSTFARCGLIAAFVFLLSLAAPASRASAAVPAGDVSRPSRAAQSVTWSGFSPVDWVTAVPFTGRIVATSPLGLEPLTDAYAVSTDGGVTWSAWSTDGLTTEIPTFTTHNIAVTGLALPDSASQNYIRFRTFETGGAEAVSAAYLVHVDTTAPAAPLGLTASPATWTNVGSFTISWTNPSDAAGIAGAWYKLGSAPTSPSDGVFVIASTSISGVTPGTSGKDDGAHPIFVWLQDKLGRANPATATDTTLYWDTTTPEPPTRMTGSPARQWTNVNKFSESWRNPSDLSGIVGAYYKLNAPPTSATDGTFVSTTNAIADIQVPEDGTHDIYVWLVDAAGNVDPGANTGDPKVFWYDGTRPVSAAIITPTLPATGWYTNSVAMSFSATDLPVDPAKPPVVEYQLDTAAWTAAPTLLTLSTEGAHQLHYRARDKAANVELPDKTFNFGIDKTAPTTTLQADRLPNSTGWYTAAVTYTLSVVDATSGSPRGYYRLNDGPWQEGPLAAPATFTLAAEGSYRIEYYGQDAAGNRSKQNTVEAHVDATPPVTGQAIDGVAGENGWHVSNVTVRLLPQDNGAGIAATRFKINTGAWQTGTQFPLAGDGIYDLAYYSTDAAGNAAATTASQVKLDTAAPAGPSGLGAAPAGWSRTNSFSVQWTSPSDLSSVTGAYVKLGDLSGGGAPTGPRDGLAISQTQRIDGLSVPAEGAYRLYLWLRDGAGNADQKTAPGIAPSTSSPVLRYDATAPVTSVQVQGQAGVGGWWLSPVTVNLTAVDGASGVAALHYRLNGGAWQLVTKNTASIPVTQPDKHVLDYYAEDVAGNVELPQQYTVRLDFAAPPAPSAIEVLPHGWTRFNSFHFAWPSLGDQSGIGGAYVKFDVPPASATDGVFYPGATEINGVRAPGEGQHSAYLWLRDGAGNANVTTAVAIEDSVWYDGTPPVTIITPTAASGLNGWYVEPVTFDVSAADAASGLLAIHYQIDNGPVQSAAAAQLPPNTLNTASSFVVSTDGRHTVRVWSEDLAGNAETAHIFEVAIDQAPPQTSFTGPQPPVTSPQFDVSWTGGDPREGSGLASYNIQVRDGYEGAWQSWLEQTHLLSAQFTGQRGHTYFFRVYGRDRAGNRQAAPGTLSVLVQPVLNGDFDNPGVLPPDWARGEDDLLDTGVVGTTGPGNVSTLAAQLGSERYGPSLDPPGMVPAGCGSIHQTITVPGPQQVRHPTLRFWYRVLSYDVMYSENLHSYVDTLDVRFVEEGQPAAYLFRTGNPTNKYRELYDTGWRIVDLDLGKYAGKTGELVFANCNGPQNGRPDNKYNTWSYVDSVEIIDRSTLFLPHVRQAGGEAMPASVASEAAPTSEIATPAPQGAEELIR